VARSGGREIDLLVQRQDENLHFKVKGEPETPEMALLSGRDSKKIRYKIGIIAGEKDERIPVSMLEAVGLGTLHVYQATRITVLGFIGMVRGIISPRNLGGPIIILKEAARSVERGFEWVLNFLVFLSVSLAVLNLLPVPILDGGHLMFFSIEALKGSPVSLRAQEWANQVGLLLLLSLMAFALTNDIWRLFEGRG
jgi:regulator of sigma E protease